MTIIKPIEIQTNENKINLALDTTSTLDDKNNGQKSQAYFDEDECENIIPMCDEVKRIAVIDGCNVLHMCKGLGLYSKLQVAPNDCKPDAFGLMLLAKNLLNEQFDVRIFISSSYMSEKVVANSFILEQFKNLDMLAVVPYGIHDDKAILEYAAEVGAFVVSNDKYRDYKHITNLRDTVSRVVPYKFKRYHDGKEIINWNRFKYCLGMELDVEIDPDIARSHIDKDPFFLMVYSQRRLRSKCRHLQSLTMIEVMADFLLLEWCFIHQVKAPHLAYFNQIGPPPSKFITFLRFFNQFLRQGENIFQL